MQLFRAQKKGTDLFIDSTTHQKEKEIGKKGTDLFKGKGVASHIRRYKRGYTTVPDHMPKAHSEYAEWTPERLVNWAAETGESTAKRVDTILAVCVFVALESEVNEREEKYDLKRCIIIRNWSRCKDTIDNCVN